MKRTVLAVLTTTTLALGVTATATAAAVNDDPGVSYKGDGWKKATKAQRATIDLTKATVRNRDGRLVVRAEVRNVAARNVSTWITYTTKVDGRYYHLTAHWDRDGKESTLSKGSKRQVCRGETRALFDGKNNVIRMSAPLSCLGNPTKVEGDLLGIDVWLDNATSDMIGSDSIYGLGARLR